MYWGISAATMEFPGTFSVKPATLKAILRDAIENLKRWGYSMVFLSNFHGDPLHCRTLGEAASEIREALGIGVYTIDAIYAEPDHHPKPLLPPPPGKFRPDVHAGADETAAMAWLYPGRVKVALAANLKPQIEFRPLGYKGDPAGYVGVKEAGDLFRFLAELQAERIEAQLRHEGLLSPRAK
jgi:creatinine amidohydrolase